MSVTNKVIHIRFNPPYVSFNPALIWNALRSNSALSIDALVKELSETAISIATRYGLMRAATAELSASMQGLQRLAILSINSADLQDRSVVGSDEIDAARDRMLLHVDSLLFEFRSYLELISKFVYGVLKFIRREPARQQTLSCGKSVDLLAKDGGLINYNFVLYLCDHLGPASNGQLILSCEWFTFLSSNRNLFTHSTAPYCAIEKFESVDPSYEILIMRKNITDFRKANANDYFRVSKLTEVISGIDQLSQATMEYLIKEIGDLPN